ncbi:MAG TPA: glycosyltransferase [Candidatus Dormibacteraeota bacterium]|nr:glycosyltransferase [Candidatus Dormibacteraeota bacterium]
MSSRRILFIAPSLPYPPHWGAATRNFQFVRHLARHDEVTLLTFVQPDGADNLEAMREFVQRLHTVPVTRAARDLKRPAQALAMVTPMTYQHLMVRSAPLQREISSLVASVDVIQVESSQMAGFDFGSGARLILDEHNIEHELLGRMADIERSPLRKAYNRLEERKFRRAELGSWRRFDGLVFTSDREQQIAAGATPRPSIVVPNGVDLDFFRPTEIPETSNDILFTGIQSYRPNHDAAMHFAREVLPLVRREVPGARFRIAGQRPSEELQRLAGPHIDVTGWVEDMRPNFEQAAVVVAPLRMGGGTRLKILEALASGRPVVSTPIGCEGLAVRDGQHLLVAEEPELFARQVVRLLRDRRLARQLAATGRRLVELEYGWAAITDRLRDFHGEVLEGARAA